jgi:transposase
VLQHGLTLDHMFVERGVSGSIPLAQRQEGAKLLALLKSSDGGAARWAVVASLVETCKLIGVEPRAYLADVITRIVNTHPNSRLGELLPWAHPPTPALKVAA